MNPEELASIWHFPVISVKATEVGKIGSKKAPPPTRLPYEQRVSPSTLKEKQNTSNVSPIQPILPTQPIFDQFQANTDHNIDSNLDSFSDFYGARIVSDNIDSNIEKVANKPLVSKVEDFDNEIVKRKGSPPSNLPIV